MKSKTDKLIDSIAETRAKLYEKKWATFKSDVSRKRFLERQKIEIRHGLERKLKKKVDEYIRYVNEMDGVESRQTVKEVIRETEKSLVEQTKNRMTNQRD